MNDIAAAIGLGNLETFQQRLRRRREIANLYRQEFANIDGLELLDYKDDRESSYWLFMVLVEKARFYIKNDEPRQKIARNGKEMFNRYYNPQKHGKDIRQVIKSIK